MFTVLGSRLQCCNLKQEVDSSRATSESLMCFVAMIRLIDLYAHVETCIVLPATP